MRGLPARGHVVFDRNCARCHGVAGRDARYPNKIVPIETIGTDPVRLSALTPALRKAYGASWFGEYGKQPLVADPGGLRAAAARWHLGLGPIFSQRIGADAVARAASRPTSENLAAERNRLRSKTRRPRNPDICHALPEAAAASPKERRRYFDTTQPCKSAAGHRFPDELNETEKRAVLEYLKTI